MNTEYHFASLLDIGADDELVVLGESDGDGVKSSLLSPVLRVNVHDGNVVSNIGSHLTKKERHTSSPCLDNSRNWFKSK